ARPAGAGRPPRHGRYSRSAPASPTFSATPSSRSTWSDSATGRPRSSLAPRKRQSPRGCSGRAHRLRSGWNRPPRPSKQVETDPVHDENDTPLSEEELALARTGEALISAAVADAGAPPALPEAIGGGRGPAAR